MTVPDIAQVQTKGTVGENPALYTDVALTDDQLSEVRGKKLRGALVVFAVALSASGGSQA